MKPIPRLALSVLAALVAVPFQGSARMGETEEQSQARYGAPVTPALDKASPLVAGMVSHSYQYQGWNIRAAFLNGVTVKIKYARIPTPGTKPQLQDEEITAILAGEAGADRWKELDKKVAGQILSSKGWLHANGNTAYGTPVISYQFYAETHIAGTSGGSTDDMRELLQLMSAGRTNSASMVTHVGGIGTCVDGSAVRGWHRL